MSVRAGALDGGDGDGVEEGAGGDAEGGRGEGFGEGDRVEPG